MDMLTLLSLAATQPRRAVEYRGSALHTVECALCASEGIERDFGPSVGRQYVLDRSHLCAGRPGDPNCDLCGETMEFR